MASIIFKNITKSYNGKSYGLIDFSCEIKSGEFVSVIGSSGSGKTTFLKIIAGLLKPDCGELYIEDEFANNISPQKRNIAMMFQEYVLYPNYNVYDNVAAFLKFNKEDEETLHHKVMNALKLFNIEEIANRKIKEISGGQQQRVALAKIFVRTPKIILLDEPLSNVDEQRKQEYKDNIYKLKKMLPNTTFIYVTHNLNEALSLADRVLLIENGRNALFTNPINLINYPFNISLVQMIDNQEMKIIKKDISDSEIFEELYYESIIQSNKEVNVIKNGENYIAFDENYKLLGGACNKIKLKANLIKNELKFNNFSLKLSDELQKRFLKIKKDVVVIFDLNKIHKEKYQNDFKLNIKFLKENKKYRLIDIDNNKYLIYKGDIEYFEEFYYNINDIEIYDLNNKKILANYIIYPNEIEVKSKNGFVKINQDKLQINKSGKLIIPLDGIKNITNKKVFNSLKIKEVISEEIINENIKLIYAMVVGFKHYITFYVKQDLLINYKERKYIEIDVNKLFFTN